ncbi:MAG: triose-phosphate isomerase [Methylotenera sp.]|uniref:triose-phosphate isomerase n=1 Tax=Methylotenera sp. TaxID=2051956 RepID=UPI002489D925|nr:triose-phosphate isomerase [Methylotenera sp.]MDI1308522.1 triose-phosphate isomerase [Methylotenera sp.]
MRRKLVVANRKMNGSLSSNKAFLEGLLIGTQDFPNADYSVCMPHPYLFQAEAILKNSPITWGGQNMSRYESGAYTGSVSPGMIKEFGCEYVIIGHSERRQRGHDTDHAIGERFEVAIKAGLKPIFCMGETLEEYEDGITDVVTIRQLNAVIEEIGVKGLAGGVLAYEPVWAIGTGKAASPEHAQNILSFLRGHIELLDADIAENIRILYGGSVKADNAAKLFSMPDIDGGLVGGASLNTDEFVAICQAASNVYES